MKYAINVLSENNPQVLYRIVGIFVRRKINIEKLSVVNTKTQGISKILININIDETRINTISKQIDRIIEVIKVDYKKDNTTSQK